MTRSGPRFSWRFALKSLLLIGILAGLSLGLGGCVSMEEYKAVQSALEQSQAQLAKADHDLMAARKQIDELNAKIADLNKLIDAGSNGVGALRQQRDLLQSQLAELQKKYDDLLKMSSTPALPVQINSALRDLAAQYPDLMEFDERLGMVRLKSDLTFDVGSTEVKPEAKRALAMLAQILNKPEIAKNEIQVVGHTDDIPIRSGGSTSARNPDNWTLSTNRAWSVLDVMRAGGVAADRGMASGWGDQRPIAPNAAGKKGNAKNRRVEIFIRPTTVPEGIVVSTPGAATPAPSRPAATRPATPARGRGAATPSGPATSPASPPLPM
jgi:flagellar motor protein MotB